MTNSNKVPQNKGHYKTKQRDLIIEYFKKSTRKHISADDIISYFKNKNISVSKSTVYRSLDMLAKENIITKYMIDEKEKACYSYNTCNEEHDHYHLRCSSCDRVFHIDGEEFQKMSNKIKKDFDFDIDMSKTVLYGKCKDCKNKKAK